MRRQPLPRARQQSPPRHQYSRFLTTNLKIFILYLMFILKYEWPENQFAEKQRWVAYCHNDYKQCPVCFEDLEVYNCLSFENRIIIDQTLASEFNKLFGQRRIQFGYYKGKKAVIKHLVNDDHMLRLKSEVCEHAPDCDDIWFDRSYKSMQLLGQILRMYFKKDLQSDGIKVYPLSSAGRFVRVFGRSFPNPPYQWMMMNLNPEPMLLNALSQRGFPVPRVLMMCGFVMVQTYDGNPLWDYYDYPFMDRLLIARNLLDAAVRFSEGVDGFRIYITDATPDNIVVNPKDFEISFVDLDSLFIVDAKMNPFYNTTDQKKFAEFQIIHRHERMESCAGCFAFVPDYLREHHISDMNIYLICHIFIQSIHGDTSHGLLHSIPDYINDALPDLKFLFTECVLCNMQCPHRFVMAQKLLETFNLMLRDFR